MNQDIKPVKLPEVEMPTAHKYKLKEELDIHKENWMHYPMSSGIATYAYDYVKAMKEDMKKTKKKGGSNG